MKILVPQLEIEEYEGFTASKDIFNRKAFGEALQSLIESTNDDLILAVDAPWGEGKSTFIKMWRGLLNDNNFNSIYFDAFKNDYQNDPFLAIAGEIYHLIDDGSDEDKKTFKEKSTAAIKVVGRVGLKIGIKALTAGMFNETVLDGVDAESEASKFVDDYVAKRLESVEADKRSLDEFKKHLEELAAKIGGGKPIVFIIDELDRCRPPFALEVLEVIKHLFSVPNIVFVLSINRKQIEESIRHEYGINIDASRYLQKFVTLWAHLPKSKEKYTGDTKIYVTKCLSAMEFNIVNRGQHDAIECFNDLADYYNLSLREIERSLTNFAIMQNLHEDLQDTYQSMVSYLSIIKVIHPSAYKKLAGGNISYSELLQETNLSALISKQSDRDPQGHFIKWSLFCSLSDQNEIDQYWENGSFSGQRWIPNVEIKLICSWMNSFN